jgi:hypothetical protein
MDLQVLVKPRVVNIHNFVFMVLPIVAPPIIVFNWVPLSFNPKGEPLDLAKGFTKVVGLPMVPIFWP